MWVELGWAWAFSEILSINNHNHLTQNPSVPTRSETSEQCGWTVRNKQPTHISILCSQIQGATRRLKQPSDQIQAAWRSPELLQRVKDALRPLPLTSQHMLPWLCCLLTFSCLNFPLPSQSCPNAIQAVSPMQGRRRAPGWEKATEKEKGDNRRGERREEGEPHLRCFSQTAATKFSR